MSNGRREPERPGTTAGSLRRVPLDAVLHVLPDLVWLKDPDGVYLACNARFEAFVGRPEDEIVGRTDFDLFPRELAEFFREKDRAATEAGHPVRNEERVTFASDGHSELLETVKTPVRDAAGRVVGVLGTGRDVTRRKRAEEALALQGLVLERIASGAPLAETLDVLARGLEQQLPGARASLLLLAPDGRTLRHASAPSLPRSWVAATDGLPVGESSGACGTAAFRREPVVCEDVLSDPSWEGLREAAAESGIRAAASVPVLGADRSVLGTLATYRAEPGSPDPAELRLQALAADLAAIAISRARAEQAAREQARLLEEVSAAAHIGGWALDPATGSGVWTDEVARIHDVEPGGATSADFGLSFFRGEDRERIEGAVREAIANGNPYDLELDFVSARGVAKRVRTVGIPVVRDGSVVQLRGTIQDVTERARAEQARERLQEQLLQARKLESVGRLAGGIAHDLNNMLSVIDGHAALALERLAPTAALRADLVEVREAAARSAELTRQLLAFARRQPAAPRPIDLNETVAKARALLARLVGEDLRLSLDLAPGLPRVRIDPAQVDQLLVALCANARDAITGVGSVTVSTRSATLDEASCAARPDRRPGEFAVLTVADDGPGIPEGVREHLFEPFFTTKELGRGTGLGLATVWGVVRQNGGFVEVDSAPGRGTAIRLYLPRFDGPLTEPAAGPDVAAPLGSGETVLLVEDEPAVLRLCAAMLVALGYRVVPAGSAEEALQLLAARADDVDVLLTDIVMPGMNGRELVERARVLAPALPCLYMSGYTADVIDRRGLLEEGVRFLAKPFSAQELGTLVYEALASAGRVRDRASGPPTIPGRGEPRRPRLLLVDDEEALVELLRRDLRKRGYDVVPHSVPVRAVEAFREDPASWDAVVTDAAMPGMSGFDVARAVLEIRPDTVVVVTSGWVDEGQEDVAREAGARAVLLKASTIEQYGRELDGLLRPLLADDPGAS